MSNTINDIFCSTCANHYNYDNKCNATENTTLVKHLIRRKDYFSGEMWDYRYENHKRKPKEINKNNDCKWYKGIQSI